MKFKMSERSLFAALLRAPWWVSFLVMLAVALVAGALLPDAYKTAGMLGAFPFLVIGVMAAWRQRNAISADRISELTEQARSMGWRDFSILVEEALRQQGFEVSRLANGPFDFQIEKNGRVTLVSAKRWKAATVGVETVRELLDAREVQIDTTLLVLIARERTVHGKHEAVLEHRAGPLQVASNGTLREVVGHEQRDVGRTVREHTAARPIGAGARNVRFVRSVRLPVRRRRGRSEAGELLERRRQAGVVDGIRNELRARRAPISERNDCARD